MFRPGLLLRAHSCCRGCMVSIHIVNVLWPSSFEIALLPSLRWKIWTQILSSVAISRNVVRTSQICT